MRRTGEVVRLSKLLTVTCLVCAHCPIVSVCCRTVWGIIGNTVGVNPIHLINTLWSSQGSYQHIFATFPATTGPLQAFYAPWIGLYLDLDYKPVLPPDQKKNTKRDKQLFSCFFWTWWQHRHAYNPQQPIIM